MTFRLSSSAFAPGGDIPARFTCDGKDLSPPLAWTDVPGGTRSLALIVDDPDAPDPKAPKRVWVHWVLYNMPPDLRALPEGGPPGAITAREGLNDSGKPGWEGPCPPIGRHRYYFRLFALDTVLPELARPTRGALEKAMSGHVLGRAELLGRYEKR